MSLAYWLNSIWMWKCAGELAAFRLAMRQTEVEQSSVLRTILRANRGTEFGRAHRFESIRNSREFQHRVPISGYDDFRAPIERIAGGQPQVLTADPVKLFEPTSGSTGGEKLVPYTDGLRRQFQRGIAAWVADLLRDRPQLRDGRAYWSISPAFGPPRRTSGGIPIGFDDDAAYLGYWEQWFLRRLLAVPSALSRTRDLTNFRYATLLHLLAADDLTLISIWNPTFLTVLLDALEPWSDRLCRDLRVGAIDPPGVLSADERSRFSLPPRRKRADQLASLFRSGGDLAEKLRQVWPRLSLVSCWADAAASRPFQELRKRLPDVEFQAKGLVATEGIVSIPLLNCAAPALAVRSHFFEFAEVADHRRSEDDRRAEDDPRAMRLAHELEPGGNYEIVLTTAGGFYRYRLGDRIEVVGHSGQCPLLRFLGRGNPVSDLVGEKLSEPHVRKVLDTALAHCRRAPRFVLLAPADEPPARYRLYLLASDAREIAEQCPLLQRLVEEGLRENPHYRYAVGLGQLAAVEIALLDPAGPSPWQVYERVCLARGQKAGNIKPAALATGMGWQDAFRPLELCSISAQAAETHSSRPTSRAASLPGYPRENVDV